jgi:hypothetical protein
VPLFLTLGMVALRGGGAWQGCNGKPSIMEELILSLVIVEYCSTLAALAQLISFLEMVIFSNIFLKHQSFEKKSEDFLSNIL